MLESLKRFKKNSLIHVCSSSEVFGRVPKEMLPIKENCNFHPASPYAISKTGTDLVARFYAEAYKMKIMTTECLLIQDQEEVMFLQNPLLQNKLQ